MSGILIGLGGGGNISHVILFVSETVTDTAGLSAASSVLVEDRAEIRRSGIVNGRRKRPRHEFFLNLQRRKGVQEFIICSGQWPQPSGNPGFPVLVGVEVDQLLPGHCEPGQKQTTENKGKFQGWFHIRFVNV